jgi:hypothetical protein
MENFGASKLGGLAQKSDPDEIIAALEIFLGDESEYLLVNRHPFGCFAKQFESFRDRAKEQRQEDFESAFLSATMDEIDLIDRELITVEVIRTGRRERCHPHTSKIWFANGYAKPCEQKSMPDVIEVDFCGTSYWIERRRAKKFLDAGLVMEKQKAC